MKPTLQSLTLLTLPVALTILLVAYPVYSWDLEGDWCVSMSSVESQGQTTSSGKGKFEEEDYTLVIQEQEDRPHGTLFYGYVEVAPGEFNGFSGAIDGKSITMTAWDSVTWGDLVVKGNHPMEIHFSNNAFREDLKVGKTALGIAYQGGCPSD